MEVLTLALLLSLIWNSCALPTRARTPLTIHPKEPLVEVGGFIQLHCSLDCPGGKAEWEGLDTDLGNVISNHTSSILTVTNAAVTMEGVKICVGQCQRKSFQKTVELRVYSLPDSLQLDSHPEVPVAGQPAHLSCSASHVYPPDAFSLSWFQGDKKVERHVEEELEESDLFSFHSELEIPMAAGQTTYQCEAQLQIGQRLFRRSKTVTIQTRETQEVTTSIGTASSQTATRTIIVGTPEGPVLATGENSSLEAITEGFPPLRSTEHPTLLTPVGTTTAPHVLESWTSSTVGRHLSTGSPSTAPLGETSTVSSSSMGLSSRTSAPFPETSTEHGVTSKTLPTRNWPSTTEFTTGGLPSKSTAAAKRLNRTLIRTPAPEGRCRPVISPFPPQGTMGGTLRITCHAVECHKGIQVQWVETPVAHSQYRQEKANGQSTLTVERVSSEHQGVYQCVVMTSQPRMASVRVVVSPDASSTNDAVITIGAAGSLLGLFITSYVSRRLWQRRSS